MAVTLTLTGSGSIGDLETNWSVQEDATPVSPADSSGGVGQVSISAPADVNSEYIINNASTFTDSVLGNISGKVGNVAVQGASDDTDTHVNAELTTKLSKLTAEALATPIWRTNNNVASFVQYGTGTGQVYNSYAIATSPLDGSVYVTSNGNIAGGGRNAVIKFDKDGNYITEWGTVAGSGNGQFDTLMGPTGIAVDPVDGSVWVGDSGNFRIQKFTSAGVYSTKVGTNGTGNGQFGGAGASTQPINLAVDASSNVYATDRGAIRIQKFNSSATYQAQVTMIGGTWIFGSAPYDIAIDSSNNVYASLITDGVPTSQPVIRKFNSSLVFQSDIPYFTIAQAGSVIGFSFIDFDENNNLWGNVLSGNYIMKINSTTGAEVERWYSGYGYSTDANNMYSMSFNQFNHVMYVYSKTGGPGGAPPTAFFGTNNRVQTFAYQPITMSTAIRRYLDLVDSTLALSYTAASNPNVVLPGWEGPVWDKLKDLCSAYNLEIQVVNDTVVVRDVGTRTQSIDNAISGTAQLTLDTNAAGRSIDINYYQYSGGSNVVYTSPTVLQVAAGERSTTTINTDNYFISVIQPAQTDSITVLPGQYYVSGSDNLPVLASQWAAYGASVSVAISTTIPGAIDVTLVGPTSAIPGVLGPYSLGISDGSTMHPAFSVTGEGVLQSKQTLNLLTGADPTKTAVLVATTIDNIFISTLAQAYDRGAWAAVDASGPVVTLSCSVPTSEVSGFGLVSGSIVSFKNAKYRVISVNVGATTTQLTCKRHTTIADFNVVGAGRTIAQFNTVWSSNTVEDFYIRPLVTF